MYINLSVGHIEILEAFSLFSIRTLEQLLIDAYPENSLNTHKVYHNYSYNWDSSRLNKKVSKVYGYNPIDVILFKENEITGSISYNSHREAKRALGVKTQSLKSYIYNTKKYHSPVLGLYVQFRLPNIQEKDIFTKNLTNKLVNNTELILANNRKLEDLSMQYIYAFNEDKIKFEVFFTNIEILKKLFPNKYNSILDNHLSEEHRSKNLALYNASRIFSMRINLEESVKIEDGSIRYFAQHPIKTKIGNKGLRENSPQWIINVHSKKSCFITQYKNGKIY